MKFEFTERGFGYMEFRDNKRCVCSVQESSNAMDTCIWLGINDADPQEFVPFRRPDAWMPLKLPELPKGGHYLFNTRMELTQEMVKELLPILQHFAETGQLPEPEDSDG